MQVIFYFAFGEGNWWCRRKFNFARRLRWTLSPKENYGSRPILAIHCLWSKT